MEKLAATSIAGVAVLQWLVTFVLKFKDYGIRRVFECEFTEIMFRF